MKNLVCAVTLLAVSTAQAGLVVQVDDDAPLGGDGLSWATAFAHLQDALAFASVNTVAEIRVGQGTYRPDQDEAGNVTPEDRAATFQLIDGVALRGGYAGFGAADPNLRDIVAFVTILSGDLLDDDVGGAGQNDPSKLDNAYHVVTGTGTGPATVLAGFTITLGNTPAGGATDIRGAGMLNEPGSPTIQDCAFVENLARNGGGMYNGGGASPQVADCSFVGNFASLSGGGVMNENNSSPSLTNCLFDGNVAENNGGGMLNLTGCDPVLTGCTFTANVSQGFNHAGAGVNSQGQCSPVFIGCDFTGNMAAGNAGAMASQAACSPTVTDCTFTGNTASQNGGAVTISFDDSATLTNCTFTNNQAGDDGGAMAGASDTTTLTDCTFDGNSAGGQGGGLIAGNSPTLRRCVFSGNTATEGGGLYFTEGTAALIDCEVRSNSADNGGGLYNFEGGNTIVANTVFAANAALFFAGGGVFNESLSDPQFVNCLFTGNTSVWRGAAMANLQSSDPVITNCTFSLNAADITCGGIYSIQSSAPVIVNSILWGNIDTDGATDVEGAQILNDGATAVVNFCAIEGWTGGLGGIGNTGDDPLLVDADGADNAPGTIDDDLHLQSGSSAINVGDNSSLPADVLDLDGDADTVEPLPVDFEHNDRVQFGVVDMGAYESSEGGKGPGTYVGPRGGSWFNPAHWSDGQVPDAQTAVVVPTPVVVDQAGAVAGSVLILGGGGLTITTGSLTTTSLLVEAGGFLTLDDPTALLVVGAIDVQAGGVVQWNAGTVVLTGTWTSPAELVMGCSGVATLNLSGGALTAPALTVCAGAAVTGDGSITAMVTSSGTFSPGQSSGTIIVDGDYTQDISGTLAAELDSYTPGGPHDRLIVTGTATLAGALDVTVIDPSMPQIMSATVVTAGAITGGFDTITQANPAGPFLAGFAAQPTAILVGVTVPGPRLHVNAPAPPDGMGGSWADALDSLEPALLAALLSDGAITEVWVAMGTYVPTTPTNPDHAQPGRTATFTIASGTAVYGGFAGTESILEQRDVTANETILSGDVVGNDGPNFTNRNDNVFHVVTGSTTDSTAVLDGFTVRAGNASGGVDVADHRGGGLYNLAGSPTLRQCTFADNKGSEGGAIYNRSGSSPTVESCTFTGNVFSAIRNFDGSNPVISDCLFDGNGGGSSGGAIDNDTASGATITSCTFTGNSTIDIGGAISSVNGSSCVLRASHFEGNTTEIEGGAIYTLSGDLFVAECTFVGNTTGIRGGAVHNEASTATFVNCSFLGSVSSSRGGAMQNQSAAQVLLIGCLFSGNYAERRGGAIYNTTSSVVTLHHCTIGFNVADFFEGGGINNSSGTAVLDNCVLWNNSAEFGLTDEAAQIFSGTVTVDYTCVQGWTGSLGGVGNIGDDPRFSDPPGSDGVSGTADDDLRLFFNSPCIDAGSNTAVASDIADLDGDSNTVEPMPLDLDGNDRFADDPLTVDTGEGTPPVVDMGVFEFHTVCPGCPGDRLWIEPTGGAYDQAANWFPDLPLPDHGVLFDLPNQFTVTFSGAASNDHLVVSNGDVTFSLGGATYDLIGASAPAVHVGLLPGKAPSFTVTGGTLSAPSARLGGQPGSSGTLTVSSAALNIAGTLEIGGDAAGSLMLTGGATVTAGNGVNVNKDASISGQGTISAAVANLGTVEPGTGGHGTLVISGDYAQLPAALGPGLSGGTLVIDVGGTAPGFDHDVLEVTGTANLSGGLIVSFDPGFVPALGQTFTVLTAGALGGVFDIAFLPAMPDGLVLTLNYDDGGQGGQPGVTLVVEELNIDFFSFDDVVTFGSFDEPTDALIADVDGDGDSDIVLTTRPPDPGGQNPPGSVLVFLNLGNDGQGNWNGFNPVPAQTLVQEQPISVATAFFDGDTHLDLVVANLQFGRVSVLLNNGLGDGTYTEHLVIDVSEGARSVTAGPLYGGPQDDFVALTSTNNRQRFFGNDGVANFSLVQTVNGPSIAREVGTLDVNNDGQLEVLAVGSAGITVTFFDETIGFFGTVVDFYPVTPGAIDFEFADMDNSGFADIVTINDAGGLASVLLNLSDGSGTFGTAMDLLVGQAPSSLAMVDLDGDDDLDLAIAAEDENAERVVRLKRNELTGKGLLTFTDASPLVTGLPAKIVLSGDLNGDGKPDLVAINEAPTTVAGIGGASISIHVNAAEFPSCPGDIDNSGDVGIVDFLALLAAWGPNPGHPADLDGDGNVGIIDFLVLLANWGPCS